MEKVQLEQKKAEMSGKEEISFSTGSTLLDLAIGGGWHLRRIFNLVGDRSSGKTLLAIEAFANFKQKFPNGKMRYAECEAALNETFADLLGMPEDVTRPDDMLDTVEQFRDDYSKFLELPGPKLYILDSLDSLSDKAELLKFEKDETDKGDYNMKKAKGMSTFFRLLTRDTWRSECCLGIISQLRDNIGVSFGETSVRSGGRALNFYSSQILWLRETGKNVKTVKGQERAIGVDVTANCKKCKVGLPFRSVDISILFNYGTNDEIDMLNFLNSASELKKKDKVPAKDGKPEQPAIDEYKTMKNDIETFREEGNIAALLTLRKELQDWTQRVWKDIDKKLAPPIRKYSVGVANSAASSK